MALVRLQKFLASAGVCSRRKAEQFISEGRVCVDGDVVTAQGLKINPEIDRVSFDGKPVKPAAEKLYYLLNKPAGYVTTLSDPQGRPIVTSLLEGVNERVFPVGRLDYDTVGALLLTNDGELAQKIQHPSFETFKTYEATVQNKPHPDRIKQLEQGLIIDSKKTAPATVNKITRLKGQHIVTLTIHEGRKHQVKKMLAAIGSPVIHLKRIAYGNLKLNNLPEGKFIKLTSSEVKLIFTSPHSKRKKRNR